MPMRGPFSPKVVRTLIEGRRGGLACAGWLAGTVRLERRYGVASVVALAFLPAGSRDFRVPCFLAGMLGPGTGDWKVASTRRQECRRYAGVPGVGRARSEAERRLRTRPTQNQPLRG
jgi:hypothetical protein